MIGGPLLWFNGVPRWAACGIGWSKSSSFYSSWRTAFPILIEGVSSRLGRWVQSIEFPLNRVDRSEAVVTGLNTSTFRNAGDAVGHVFELACEMDLSYVDELCVVSRDARLWGLGLDDIYRFACFAPSQWQLQYFIASFLYTDGSTVFLMWYKLGRWATIMVSIRDV